MDEAPKPDAEDVLAHAHDLRKLARALVSDPDAADDLAQDAWVEILEGRAKLDQARRAPAWLFGVLRNLRSERARREGRRAHREAAAARAHDIGGENEIVERLETFRALAAELEQLGEPYRSSLWRRFFENETAEQIAAREGISPATVRSRWMRALAMLRERLDRGAGGRERWLPALWLIADLDRPTREPKAAATLLGATALLAVVVAAVELAVPGGSTARIVDPTVAAVPIESASASIAELEPVTRRALDLETAASPADVRSPLRLALVDAFTHEALPAMRVRIDDADGPTEWTTDGDGRLVTRALLHGTLGVEVQDGAKPLAGEGRSFRRSRRIAHDGRDEIELAVPSGPTFELAIEAPPSVALADLVARLATRRDAGARSSATARVRVDPASGDDSHPRTWVRFGADGAALAGGGPWLLRVETPDARFAGETTVGALRGHAQGPLEIRLTERAELVVRVRDGAGNPLDARVEIAGSSGLIEGTTANGELRATGLAPERVHVIARAFGLPPREAFVDVRPPTCEGSITFDDAVERDRVAGVVRHALAPGRSLRVVLRDAKGVERTRTITNADPLLAHGAFAFSFDDVPIGLHELFVEARDVWRWDPPVSRVHPPALGLSLSAEPLGTSGSFVVRARDAETGAAIEHFDVRVELEGAAPLERSTSIAGMTFPSPPDGARIAWVVAAAGFATVRGHETAIRQGPDRKMLEVALRRGFSLRVHVVDDASGAALAGADVEADGRSVARTDANGDAEITAESTPRALGIALAGRSVVGGDVDPTSGSWQPSEVGRVVVRTAPRP